MKTIVGLVLAGCSALALIMWGMPQYNVWQQGLSGEAALNRATADRQIAIKEAEARLESARLDAQAEVVKAKGSAEANTILADSLSNPHADKYLQLRYIQVLENSRVNREIIYVPNGPLPVPEAGRAALPNYAPQ